MVDLNVSPPPTDAFDNRQSAEQPTRESAGKLTQRSVHQPVLQSSQSRTTYNILVEQILAESNEEWAKEKEAWAQEREALEGQLAFEKKKSRELVKKFQELVKKNEEEKAKVDK